MAERTTTLVVLAGGAGSRMGMPKGLLHLGGVPILERLLNRLRWEDTMLVTTPGTEHPPGWKGFDREVTDPVSGQGPLRGIVTALETGIGAAVIVPVDMPMITESMLRWLSARPVENGVFVRRGKQIESMPVFLTNGALPIARMRLNAGRRSVHGLSEEAEFSTAAAPNDWPEEVWLNVNEPADLAKLNVPQVLRSN